MIDGVVVKELVTHADPRGFFRELIRVTDASFESGFGQLSHSLVHEGVLKAWHGHRRQTQWTYAAAGVLKVAIHDARKDSLSSGRTLELLVGEGQPARIYSMPPGVVHGYRCVAGPAHVIYVTSGTYDFSDELRLPPDDPAIGYNWEHRA
jgi:dTDP-4-dehydrorhamnose 3,5-epimerase